MGYSSETFRTSRFEGIWKGHLFYQKWYIMDSGRSLSLYNFVEYAPLRDSVPEEGGGGGVLPTSCCSIFIFLVCCANFSRS